MADIIRLLPDAISNQIAAGEVIQRPASVVKELVENAVDSGADNIQIIIKEAGRKLIRVMDNGCGMSPTDALVSFEKHATSKIENIDDLFHILTMGFRGEALASMAAVAHVEMKTRLKGEDVGTEIQMAGSTLQGQSACQTPEGTSVSVKNLFYNVPARRNFLKSDAVEMKHIIEEFHRIALAHPELSFSLTHNEQAIYQLKSENLRQRIVHLFGKKYNEKLIPFEESSEGIKVYGFIGKPESAKRTRGEQYIFVNARFIKSHYLNHAVFKAFENLLSKDHFPLFVLKVEIEPSKIDINVHPSKHEVKFEDERLVYTFVNSSIKHALGKHNITPSIDFDQEPSMNALKSFQHIFSNDADTIGSSKRVESNSNKPPVKGWENLFQPENQAEPPAVSSGLFEEESNSYELFQIHGRYIVSPIKSGFILIDQRLAHERILYEKYLNHLKTGTAPSQQLLFPVQIELSAPDAVLLTELMRNFQETGFRIEPFGQNTFVVQGWPADLPSGNEANTVLEILEDYKNTKSMGAEGQRELLVRSVAKSGAVRRQQKLSSQEMQALVDDLFSCHQPYAAPNGAPTLISFDLPAIEQMFQKQS